MERYKEYKEIDERYVKGRKVDVHKKYVKYKLYKETKIMEKEGIKKPFKVMKIGNSYCVIGDNIRFIAAKIMGFEKIPCLIIDTNKRRFLLRKNNKRNQIKDEKSKTRMYGKMFNDCKRKYITIDI